MRLALITQDFSPEIGGIQTYCIELAKRLQPMCDDFVLIAPNKPTAPQIDAELPFDVERINTPNTLLGTKGIRPVLKILKARKTTVIFHAQWHTLPIGVRAKKLGIVDRIVAAAHGRELFFNPFKGKFLLEGFYSKYRKYLLSKADYFMPVSTFNSNQLGVLGVPENKRTVVINGTNPDFFFPLDADKLKKEYGYEGKKTLLTTTRMVERKGVDTVLRALPAVVEKIPNLKYLVVGDGEYTEQLKQLCTELNITPYVDFVGRIPYSPKLNTYYNIADIFILASKAVLPEVEGFGIVYLEANACEKPAIGTRSGGIPDAILHEKTGLLVEERNHTELAQAIIRLLSNDELRHKMGKYGRQRVEQEANWNAVTERIFNCLVG